MAEVTAGYSLSPLQSSGLAAIPKRCYFCRMPNRIAERPALASAIILQDRKRLPVRFFGAFSGAMLSRLH